MGLFWDYDYGWTLRPSILGSDSITQSELSEMKIEWSHTFVLLHHNIYVMLLVIMIMFNAIYLYKPERYFCIRQIRSSRNAEMLFKFVESSKSSPFWLRSI